MSLVLKTTNVKTTGGKKPRRRKKQFPFFSIFSDSSPTFVRVPLLNVGYWAGHNHENSFLFRPLPLVGETMDTVFYKRKAEQEDSDNSHHTARDLCARLSTRSEQWVSVRGCVYIYCTLCEAAYYTVPEPPAGKTHTRFQWHRSAQILTDSQQCPTLHIKPCIKPAKNPTKS